MKALVFGVTPQDVPAPPPDAPRLLQNLAATPMALQDVDEPKLFGPDWTVLRTRLTGICGSDAKQALLDFDSEAGDNPMSAFISFPQVMGHEVVATVDQAGTEA
ncbi:MAG: alcohol dehydrogenase catalytic domain-containing protein, partial [Acidimicrobiales bacterium]